MPEKTSNVSKKTPTAQDQGDQLDDAPGGVPADHLAMRDAASEHIQRSREKAKDAPVIVWAWTDALLAKQAQEAEERRLNEEHRILAAVEQADALATRARRAWKSRAKRTGAILVVPGSACVEAHGSRPYIVLRAEVGVVAEYAVTGNRLRFVAHGPARTQEEHQRRAAQEKAELASLRTADLGVLLPRALECLHALNRYAKHPSSRRAVQPAPRPSTYDPYDRPWTMRDRIYSVKDRLLVALACAGKAQVFYFQMTKQSKLHTCSECRRDWFGDSYCYECNEPSGIPETEVVTWYVLKSEGYRFHQPRVPQDVAALATVIEPHNPTQPMRDVPDVGLSRVGQLECVELAIARLEALGQTNPPASPETEAA